ncbi:MAG: glycosyltransferase [Acidimicrobiales bacterium]|nr:glycosyltransferase [Acidimicrobiales bacterium]
MLPVVIVHWNRPERCLGTVQRFRSLPVPGGVRVVVVDNGSAAPALAVVRQGLPDDVPLVALPRNRGFGPGANAGFRHVLENPQNGDLPWIGLAPHDAEPAPDCLTRMLDAVGPRRRAGLASADFGDGATPVVDPYFGGILAPARVGEGWEAAGHPHGTLMLAHGDLLREVGLFDERYFAYCEEADLALRAAAAGWETGLVRGAIVVNPDMATRIAAVDYLQLRNTLLLVREHFGRYRAFIRFCLAILQLVDGLARPSRRGPYFVARARAQALVDHARGRYGPPPRRYLDRELRGRSAPPRRRGSPAGSERGTRPPPSSRRPRSGR